MQRLLHGLQVMLQVAIQVFKDDREDGCEPSHGSVREQSFPDVFPSVSLHLHGQGIRFLAFPEAPTHRGQQHVVDLQIERAVPRVKEARCIPGIHRHFHMAELPAVIQPHRRRKRQQFLLDALPVGNLQSKPVAVAPNVNCASIVLVCARLPGQPDRLVLPGLREGALQIGQNDPPGDAVDHKMVRGDVEIIPVPAMDQGCAEQSGSHVDAALDTGADIRDLRLRGSAVRFHRDYGVRVPDDQPPFPVDSPQHIVLVHKRVQGFLKLVRIQPVF